MNDWTEYVRQTVEEGERQRDIAERTGVDQTTISRWLKGTPRAITPATVARFARGYGRPVLEAFIIAKLISESDAHVRVIHVRSLQEFSTDELLSELSQRQQRRELVPSRNGRGHARRDLRPAT